VPGLGPNLAVGAAPTLEYDFYTFNTPSTGGATTYKVTAYIWASFSALPDALSYGISLDGGAVQTVTPIPAIAKGQYNPPDWNKSVADGVRVVQTNFTDVAPGKHTLRIEGLSPTLVFEKFVSVHDWIGVALAAS
jgi:hypothetical protein